MTFRDPWWLIALIAPLVMLWRAWKARGPFLQFPETQGLQEIVRKSLPHQLRWPGILRTLSLVLIVFALARPQQGVEATRIRAEGIDIALVIDVSTSMLAEDFTLKGQRHSRIDVVKEVTKTFIHKRPDDRISIVIFGGGAYTAAPPTLDHGWLLAQADRLKTGMVEDGTAIGSGIATGLNRLRDSTAKSRVMVLLTDGVNNAGSLTPDAAAELARALDVKIYAIGAGTKGPVPYPVVTPFGRKSYRQVRIDIDDAALTRVAETTGGKYFRATDTDSLKRIYEEINALETTAFEQPQFLDYREGYPWLVVPALIILLMAFGLDQTLLRVLP